MPLPSNESLFVCMKLATTPEAAEHLHEVLRQRLKQEKVLEKSGPLLDAVQKYAEYVRFKHENPGKAWSGDIQSVQMTDFEKWQTELARISGSEIVELNVLLDFAVSDKSEFIRGYSSEGQPLQKASGAAMDVLFNAWLAGQQMISKDGVLYESTEKGEIKKDANGQPVKADPEVIKKLLSDEMKGFPNYAEQRKEGVKVTAQGHPYTAPAQEKGTEAEPVEPNNQSSTNPS